MTEYYIEIVEEQTEIDDYKPPQMMRKYVKDSKEAETEHTKAIKEFDNKKVKSTFIEMNHNIDSKLNKPCISKEIKKGKVQ